MNTAKPIATISYNSEPFLRQKLSELYRAKKIDFWAFIHHLPEDDEAGNKPHFHLYIEPSKRTQTAILKDEFKEFDLTHPDKPLGVLSFRPSHFGDWYLYGLHDPAYLAAKMQSRRYSYDPELMQKCDEDELRERVYTVDVSEMTPIKRLKAFKESGKTFTEAVRTGLVPIPQIAQYERTWNLLLSGTDRNGRPGHDEEPPESDDKAPTSPVQFVQLEVDPLTGETRERA